MMELSAGLREFFSVDSFDAILNIEGKVFREHKNRKTLYFKKDGKGYFLKVHRGAGWKEIFKNLFSLRLPIISAGNELAAIRRLEELGIETMKVAGFGERGTPPARLESFIITEELEGTVSLEDFTKGWKSDPPDFLLKAEIIKKVAEIARLLHRNGINHRDFYICHFLLEPAGLNREINYRRLRIYLIDLHRVQVRDKTPERWIVKDLAGLFFSSMDAGLTRRDYLRFMRIYSGKPLRSVLKEDHRLWARVHTRALKLYARHFHRLPDIPPFYG